MPGPVSVSGTSRLSATASGTTTFPRRQGSGGSTPLTADEVIAKYVANHGEQILIAPTATGFNLLAWIGPIIGLLLGLVVAVVVVRRLARREPQPPVLPAGPPVEQDAVYRERLRRQLAEWD